LFVKTLQRILKLQVLPVQLGLYDGDGMKLKVVADRGQASFKLFDCVLIPYRPESLANHTPR
jgi:hypothetical protein